MSVAHTDPEVAAVVSALKESIQDLPIERQDAAFEQMGSALVEVKRSGSPAAVTRYVQSLYLTARLHRNPAYKKALAEADAEFEQEIAESLPVSTFVDQMRARYA
jgi:hypothetical protein